MAADAPAEGDGSLDRSTTLLVALLMAAMLVCVVLGAVLLFVILLRALLCALLRSLSLLESESSNASINDFFRFRRKSIGTSCGAGRLAAGPRTGASR